jgi:hypothetical protein
MFNRLPLSPERALAISYSRTVRAVMAILR